MMAMTRLFILAAAAATARAVQYPYGAPAPPPHVTAPESTKALLERLVGKRDYHVEDLVESSLERRLSATFPENPAWVCPYSEEVGLEGCPNDESCFKRVCKNSNRFATKAKCEAVGTRNV